MKKNKWPQHPWAPSIQFFNIIRRGTLRNCNESAMRCRLDMRVALMFDWHIDSAMNITKQSPNNQRSPPDTTPRRGVSPATNCCCETQFCFRGDSFHKYNIPYFGWFSTSLIELFPFLSESWRGAGMWRGVAG